MFTGLIEDCGTLKSVVRTSTSAVITLNTALPTESLMKGDSVAVNGVCLTVVEKGAHSFSADVSPETFSRSTLELLRSGSRVNLERALRVGDRLGGHIVTGHVDAIGTLKQVTSVQNAILLEIGVPDACSRYLVEKGSVAVDGISLTINSVKVNSFELSIIPHTLDKTTLKDLSPGSKVNIETDILGKYVERLMGKKPATESSLTSELLAKHGFL
jgi:riboflavin synthase